MFTGIVEAVGKIKTLRKNTGSATLAVCVKLPDNDLKCGDSVAVNGVCLTVTAICGDTFDTDVGLATLKATNIGALKDGNFVNIERAARPQTRLGGHIVQGHVDGVTKILNINKITGGVEVEFHAGPELLKYIVKKGSVAVNGVSLTVSDITQRGFKVFLIPHTVKSTIFAFLEAGDEVNLEVDIIGKYVEKFVASRVSDAGKSGISEEFLKEHGF